MFKAKICHLSWHATSMRMLKKAMDQIKVRFSQWELCISNLIVRKTWKFHFSKDLRVNLTFQFCWHANSVKIISHYENHDFFSSIAFLIILIHVACQKKWQIFALNISSLSVALRNWKYGEFLLFYTEFLCFHIVVHFTLSIGEKWCKFNILFG